MRKISKFFKNKRRVLAVSILSVMAGTSLAGIAPMTIHAVEPGTDVVVGVYSSGGFQYKSSSTPVVGGANIFEDITGFDIGGEAAFSVGYDAGVADGDIHTSGETFSGLAGSKLSEIEKIVHYGFTSNRGAGAYVSSGNPTTDNNWFRDYAVTKIMLQEVLDAPDAKGGLGGSNPDVNGHWNGTPYASMKAAILKKVNDHDVKLSFDKSTQPISVGETITIKDANNVLADMYIGDLPSGIRVRKIGSPANTLEISADPGAEGGVIKLTKVIDSYVGESIPYTGGSLTPDLGVFKMPDEGLSEFTLTINGETTIEITKRDEVTNDPLSGSLIALYSGNKLIDDARTGSDGKVIFNVGAIGNYHYVELEAPTGYILDSAKHNIIVRNHGDSIRESSTNKKAFGQLEITKVDKQDRVPLRDASFSLYTDAGKFVSRDITNSRGIITFENLELGSYYFEETKAPDGYNLDRKKHRVRILEDGQIIQKTVENERETATVRITKVDKRTDKVLPGAIIGVYDANTDKLVQRVTTDRRGVALFDELEVGDYYYTEIEAPKGYILDKTQYEFEISGRYLGFIDTLENTKEGDSIKGPNDKTDSADNLFDPDVRGNIEITITNSNGNAPIQGVELGVYRKTGNTPLLGSSEPVDGVLIEIASTGVDGKITVRNLQGGNYYYKQLKAPAGFALDPVLYPFTVLDNGVLITRGSTIAPVSLTGQKVDVNGNPIQGVEFGLYDSDNNLVASAVTGPDGLVSFVGVKPGDYVIKETAAAEGFQKTQTTHPVSVTDEHVNSEDLDFEDKGVEIIKTGGRIPVIPIIMSIVVMVGILGVGGYFIRKRELCEQE